MREAQSPQRSYVDEVIRYYDSTWFDYRTVWLNGRNLAKHWGFWGEGIDTHAESLIQMNREVAARADPRPGETVLDAGCGVGGTSLWLAESYGVNVVGVSLSAKEVGRARAHALRRGLGDRVSFEQENFLAMSFPDASFDLVWAQESVCHVPDKARFFAEASRVLKPGGRLVMEDWFRHRRPYPQAQEQLLKRWLAGWAIPDLATPEELRAWGKAAGFTGMTVEDISAHVEPSMRRLYRLGIAFYPGALLLRALRIRSDVEHGNIRSARLHRQAYRRHLWFVGILAARK